MAAMNILLFSDTLRPAWEAFVDTVPKMEMAVNIYAERNRKVAQARSANTMKRFLAKVEKSKGCWIWQGSCWKNGYGCIQHQGRRQKAHRVAYQLLIGPIPGGLFVCHTCDIPSCVRPEHLFLGTARDNTCDAIAKGRIIPIVHSKETRERIAAWHRGRTLSPETRAKISSATKGRSAPEAARYALSIRMRGVPKSKAQRQAMSYSRREFYARPGAHQAQSERLKTYYANHPR